MPLRSLVPIVLLSLILAGASHGVAQDSPAPSEVPDGDGTELPVREIAGDIPHGVLAFSVVDDAGRPIPARLTFTGAHAPGTQLFPRTAVAPAELAVRDDLVYTLSGRGRITVPVGTYTIIASHGLEYSIDRTTVTIVEGGTAEFDARLVHEIDSAGWVSADFHLHTFTFSGHGDANLPERVISILGEGLEVAVATDHNHHTDYAPVLAEIGAPPRMLPIVGNEVSTPIGHFNVFPVNPRGPLLPHRISHAPTLFTAFRSHDSGVGVRTVIQVNHPRWAGIDYFGQTDLDPITGLSENPNYSRKFDSIEVLNENAGWGYHEAGVDDIPTGSSRHSALEDWFSLLDQGQMPAAVGNSDSHAVRAQIAGIPRNFLRVPTDSPSELDHRWIADAVRGKRLFTTTGPFVTVTANGMGMGSRVAAGGEGIPPGAVTLDIRVQAASWIDVDRVIVVVNGDRAHTITVPEVRTPLRLETQHTVQLPGDGWVVLLVEGDDPMAPVFPDTKRPIRPVAITNPIWVDADRDGMFLPPTAAATRTLATLIATPARALPLWQRSTDAERRRLLLATRPEHPFATELVRAGLADPVRRVRIAASILADRLDDPALDSALVPLVENRESDPYARLRALRAITDPATRRARLLASLRDEGTALLAEGGPLLADDLPGDFVRRWRVLGYFDAERETGREGGDLDPAAESARERYLGNRGEIGWEVKETRSNGYLDLLGLDEDPLAAERAHAYGEIWVHSDRPRPVDGPDPVLATVGSDDGCLLQVGGMIVLEDTTTHAADPNAHVVALPLEAGWNRVLLRVTNGRGGFGAYLRILEDDLPVSIAPDRRD